MSTFTTSLGLVKQIVGENSLLWGNVLNSQLIDMVDQAIAGATEVDVTTGNVTLTKANGDGDQARSMILIVSGNPDAARSIIVPTVNKIYAVGNDTSETVTIRTADGDGADIAAGERKLVFIDANRDEANVIVIGTETVQEGGSEAALVPSSVDDAIEGDDEPDYRSFSEGHLTLLRSNGYRVRVNATTFVVRPQTGSYPTPQVTQDTPMFIRENGTLHACVARVVSGIIVFFKVDGTDWSTGSVRTVYAHEMKYSESAA